MHTAHISLNSQYLLVQFMTVVEGKGISSTFTTQVCKQWDIQVYQEQMVQDQQLQLLQELEGEEAKKQTQNKKCQEKAPLLPIAGLSVSISPAEIGVPQLSEAVAFLLEVDRNALSVTLVTFKMIGGFADEEDE